MPKSLVYAQWSSEWTSSSLPTSTISGWLYFGQNGDDVITRYYTLDSLSFVVMEDAYSQLPAFTYTFTTPERFAGNYLYSLGMDLTGDDVFEYYVLGAYGTVSPYRQSFKIFDLTTNIVVFERNNAGYSYGLPGISDLDRDGTYECSFSRADYPSGANYVNEVYNTNVPALSSGDAPRPKLFGLGQNYPNPFNPNTRIDYQLKQPGNVELDIVNALGQRVGTLHSGQQNEGLHSVTWDGRTENGTVAPSGMYFYRLRIDDSANETKKMILVR